MAIGFDVFNFEVQGCFRGPDLETLKKCCEPGHQFVFLKDRDQLKELPIKHLIGVHSFFTGKELKEPEPGEEREWREKYVPVIRTSFDDKFIQDYKVVLALKAEEKKTATKPAKAPEPESETETPKQSKKEKEKMAPKSKTAKKAPAKKAAPKAAKKESGDGQRGRKAPYAPDVKLFPLVKENPCHPTFNGKPGVRHANMEIILKNPGITFEKFLAKGGTLHDLQGLAVRKKYVRVGK